jgi:NAD(P)-dependent dehydrogenase (short-subunit alcohol dehydrogenase family)
LKQREDIMASVLITGTSTGIGLATALALGRAGHNVYATMRNPARAPELGQIAAAEKLPIKISVMDVDSDDSVKSAIESIQREAGHIDVLVNNAGVERSGSIEELPLAEFRAVMETNYFGVLRCIQAVVAQMRQRRSGCIINVSSVAGRISCTPMGPYTASKFALEAVSEVLAQEMKSFNVRVALVEPGIIDTPMARRISEPGKASNYPQQKRFAHLFIAALKNPASPSFVAETIKGIIESGTQQLRHPTGPDALPFLGWRGSMTDEQWVDLYAADDDTWYAQIERDFRMVTRPKS